MNDPQKKKELTVSAGQAQLYALGLVIPMLVFFALIYYLIWFDTLALKTIHQVIPRIYIMAIIILGGIILHELLHGITWAFFCKKGLRAIKFGIMWKSLTPYCHCNEPLKINYYVIGGMMPAIVLGFIPMIAGLITGKLSIFLLGMFFILAAGGDFLIIWMLRNESKDVLVQDHHDKIGCFVYESESSIT